MFLVDKMPAAKFCSLDQRLDRNPMTVKQPTLFGRPPNLFLLQITKAGELTPDNFGAGQVIFGDREISYSAKSACTKRDRCTQVF
jgi:hypothetical protein